jgi:hypothetical protein
LGLEESKHFYLLLKLYFYNYKINEVFSRLGDKFVTFGCSYSNGHKIGETGSWGYHLSKLLNCKLIQLESSIPSLIG